MLRLRAAAVLCLLAARAAPPTPEKLRLDLLETEGAPLWPRSIQMRDAEGRLFECSDGAEAHSKNTTNATVAPVRLSVGAQLALLEGTCATLHQGWWTYEWCHRAAVRQFHLVQMPSAVQTTERDPDWSLGGYTRTVAAGAHFDAAADAEASVGIDGEAIASKTVAEAAALSVGGVVDIFDAGGQNCDEIGRGRQSLVSFKCCSSKRERKLVSAGAGARAFLTAVEETALCDYAVTVCAPHLCTSHEADVTAVALLRSLEGVCLQRHAGWWSFELCYQKHARQFHVETVEGVEGAATARVGAEFLLGRSVADASGESEARVPRRVSEELRVFEAGADAFGARVDAEYGGGTACDVSDGDARRGTTVRFICGESDALVSVVEDRTCHYVFTVTCAALCKHPAFVSKVKKRAVTCGAVDPQRQ
ncbi:hypothetical protein M885DRAFT_613746 [Pelagophyceae sp. CCMP2097]|nr:hypothetical protein M885DRAFT_613746 [Pelagophyceae sp. CCMP2097]